MATPSSIRRVATSRLSQIQCRGDTTPTCLIASSPPVRQFACSSSRQRRHPSSSRHLSNGAYVAEDSDAQRAERPRWQSTPEGMSMPFRIRPVDRKNQWRVNEDPRKVGEFYNRFLGTGGENMLTEETRWLAITHKSFDQGRRGFNDRLSYLGKRIVDLQTSLALVAQPRDPLTTNQGPDRYGRYPYQHVLLDGLEHLSESQKSAVLSKQRLAQLGVEYGLDVVLRWKPKKADNLSGSGVELVMAQAMYAIVGAVALEKGGQLANQITREKILRPLGVILMEQS